jgi:hypothetical protein
MSHFNGVFAESALVRLFVGFGLFTSFAQMVRFCFTIVTKDLLAFRAIDPVKGHMQGCLVTDFFTSVVLEADIDAALFKCEYMPTRTLSDRVVLCAENAHLMLLDLIFFLLCDVLIVFPLCDLHLALTASWCLIILEGLDDVFP